jgi:hypothetical protein
LRIRRRERGEEEGQKKNTDRKKVDLAGHAIMSLFYISGI